MRSVRAEAVSPPVVMTPWDLGWAAAQRVRAGAQPVGTSAARG
ncbi:MAG TPA: hypothetical protein VFT38_06050 [Vicinamibacteria bacterium]|nr:hypothetical protein [Vicinamibacteria bacterium]